MRRIQKLCKLSTDTRSSNSSGALLGDVSEGSVNLLIQQLKVNILEVDLLNFIKGDAQLGIDIQKLLVELNRQRVSDSIV